MKRVIAVLVLIALLLSGCKAEAKAETEDKEGRFKIVYQHGIDFSFYQAILEDTETGDQYLFIKSGYGAGLTQMK